MHGPIVLYSTDIFDANAWAIEGIDFISDSVWITFTVLVLTKDVLDYCIDELPIALHGLSTTTKQRHHNSLPASTSLSSCPPFCSDVLLRSEKIEVNSDQSKFWSIFCRLPFRAFLVNFWLDGLFLPSNLFILMDSSILVRARLLYSYTVWIFFSVLDFIIFSTNIVVEVTTVRMLGWPRDPTKFLTLNKLSIVDIYLWMNVLLINCYVWLTDKWCTSMTPLNIVNFFCALSR